MPTNFDYGADLPFVSDEEREEFNRSFAEQPIARLFEGPWDDPTINWRKRKKLARKYWQSAWHTRVWPAETDLANAEALKTPVAWGAESPRK